VLLNAQRFIYKPLGLIKKKIASFKILVEKKIILEYFSGSITWTDVKKLKMLEIHDLKYNNTYNLIGDLRNSNMLFQNKKEITEFLDFIRLTGKSNSEKKVAILTSSPNNVVTAELLRLNKDELPQILKTFSTVESLLSWLDVNKKEIYDALDEHRRNPNNIL